MVFAPELARRVLDGTKTVTRRLCSENPRSPWSEEACAYTPGSLCAVQPGRGKPAIGRVRILAVRRERLGVVTLGEAHREGFTNLPEFKEAWIKINGSYDPKALVWRVEFEILK